GFSNSATLLRPLIPGTAEATLEAIAGFFAFADPRRTGEVPRASACATPDRGPFGWTLMGHPPLHLLPAGATPRPAPPELRIEAVRGVAGLPADERGSAARAALAR